MNPYLEQALIRLDADQRAFVEAPPAPRIFLSASAGSGKTTSVVAKAAWLVHCGWHPESIYATTFTTKAAGELSERLEHLGAPVASSTLHALCFRVLRETGVSGPIRVVDNRVRCGIINRLRETMGLKSLEGSPFRWLSMIGRERAHLRAPGEATSLPGLKAEQLPDFAMLFGAYDTELEHARLLDFDAMQSRFRRALDEVPGLQDFLRARIQWLFMDEFQDFTPEQRHICERICGGTLAGIADFRQSIYSFRSADYEGNVAWARSAVQYNLRRNYRADATLVRRMNAMMPGEDPLSPPMVATKPEGAGPTVVRAADVLDEASTIGGEIQRLLAAGAPPREVAVIYRLHALGGPVELELLRRGIPYRVAGGRAFYDLAAVKQALAYLRLSQGDDDEALQRIYNLPRRYLGHAFWAAYETHRAAGKTTIDALHTCATNTRWKGAGDLARDLRRLRLAPPEPHAVLKLVYELVGRGQDPPTFATAEAGEDEADDREATLSVLLDLARGFPSTAELVTAAEGAAGRGGEEADEGRVWMMSAHRSKGLEFDHVFSPGWSAKAMPHPRGDAAEERRIAFVIGTRARKTLHLSWPAGRPPSPFLWSDLLPKPASPGGVDAAFDNYRGRQLARLQGDVIPWEEEADEDLDVFPALADENVVQAGLTGEAVLMPDLARRMEQFRYIATHGTFPPAIRKEEP